MSPSHHIPLCFRPPSATTAGDDHRRPPLPPSPPPSAISGNPNLATCLYQTHLGVFSLTWSRTFFGHSLYLYLHSQDYYCHSSPYSLSSTAGELSVSSLISFNLHINPFAFWRKHGSRRISPNIQVFWDLTRVKFGSGPEPRSGFYIAVVADGDMGLLVGDCIKEAYARTRARKPTIRQAFVLRREHVFGSRVFYTAARFGGKNREISIDCRVDEDARLCFSVDNRRVLQIKRLRWKFRGNEKIEVDGVHVQISWDVYNWLFENKNSNSGHAVFMFRFDGDDFGEEEEHETMSSSKQKSGVASRKKTGDIEKKGVVSGMKTEDGEKNGVVLWQRRPCSFGMIGGIVEWRKMRRSFLRSARSSSSSSISMSSASSACSSSVLEWASSADEAEYGGGGAGGAGGAGGHGFSLLVYAWRK